MVLVLAAVVAASCTRDASPPTASTAILDLQPLPRLQAELITHLFEPVDTVVAANGEWWIAQRSGEVVVVDPTTGDVGDVVVDLSAVTEATGEQGLLGLAATAEALYVDYTGQDGTTHVDAFRIATDGRPGDRVELLSIPQPFPHHNGGGLAIERDGRLLIAVGDGGAELDEVGNAQNPGSLLGAILRIQPTPAEMPPYRIPESNPYGDGAAPEVYVIGVRNPWRISVDPLNGDLWIADVGEDRWEEITRIESEATGPFNLGWPLREGDAALGGAPPPDHVDPVFVYSSVDDDPAPSGCSVVGGEVYRGDAIPELVGAYVFGDFCTARLWALRPSADGFEFVDLRVDVPGGWLTDIGTDPGDELVALSLSGAVVRLRPR